MFECTLTPKEFADEVGIAYTTVLLKMDKGIIEFHQEGRSFFIHEDEVAKFRRIQSLGLTLIGDQEFLTTSKLALYLGMSYHKTLTWILDCGIPHRKIKGFRYISFVIAQEMKGKLSDEVDEFLDSL